MDDHCSDERPAADPAATEPPAATADQAARAPGRRVAVVMNGKAGALLDQPGRQEAIDAAFADAGLSPEFVGAEAGTLPERLALAAGSGPSAVIVAGGDGTVACAAEALSGTGIPLGVVPFGTMNMLAKDLGLPIADWAEALDVLGCGRERAIDVGEVNGHAFLCASMLGAPAQIGRVREQTRGVHGALSRSTRLLRAVVRFGARSPRHRFRLFVDGRAIRVHAASITVVVNRLDGDAGTAFKRVRLDGGQLAAYVVPKLTVGSLITLAWRKLRGRWLNTDSVQEHLGREIVIESSSAALHAMNDGEARLIEPPLRYAVRPGALRVIAPAQ